MKTITILTHRAKWPQTMSEALNCLSLRSLNPTNKLGNNHKLCWWQKNHIYFGKALATLSFFVPYFKFQCFATQPLHKKRRLRIMTMTIEDTMIKKSIYHKLSNLKNIQKLKIIHVLTSKYQWIQSTCFGSEASCKDLLLVWHTIQTFWLIYGTFVQCQSIIKR